MADTSKNNNNNRKNVSYHILPTAANLLGICFVILSFIRVTKTGAETLLDELLAAAIVIFLASCILSYASMRTAGKTDFYEKTADIIFLAGLALLSLISVITFFVMI